MDCSCINGSNTRLKHMSSVVNISYACFQAMSPDGEAIVTGAGDETLRFWNVFSKTRSTKVGSLPV